MSKIILAGLVAVVAVLLISPAAYAAPSMTVTDVVSPTGSQFDNPDARTTWNVSLSGISAWDTSQCSSTARFANGESFEGEDYANDNWKFWPFSSLTPIVSDDDWSFDDTYAAVSSVTARCVLEKKTYLGRRPYREAFTREKSGSSAFRRGGCPVYPYSIGKLTIDCRHSSRSGYASWRFPLRRSDIVLGTWNYFDRSESTIGAHNLRAVRSPKSVVLTETVSPGTMITVAEVDVKISRRYWRAAYLKQKTTLRASWYPTYQYRLEHGG
jgi:hypothetical protein